MARHDPQVNLRMPEALKLRLEEAATKNNRSLTSEIVARLEASFKTPEDLVTQLTQIMNERDVRILSELKTSVQQMLVKATPDKTR